MNYHKIIYHFHLFNHIQHSLQNFVKSVIVVEELIPIKSMNFRGDIRIKVLTMLSDL
jgi:hypothetical protein